MQTEYDNLKRVADGLKSEREEVKRLLETVSQKIVNDLSPLLNQKAGKTMNPANIPLMKAVRTALQGVMVAPPDRLKQLRKEVVVWMSEIKFSMEDLNDPNKSQELIDAVSKEDEKDSDALKQRLQWKAEYDSTVDETKQLLKELKSLGAEDQERKRISTLRKEAIKEHPKNLKASLDKIKLAARMARQLKADPTASGMTERGQEHLKDLNARWSSAVGETIRTAEALSTAVGTACARKPDPIAEANKIVDPINKNIVERLKGALDPSVFASDLLVLQTPPPSAKKDKDADRERKKKYRESALAKVRRLRDLITKDPVLQSVAFQPNPFKQPVVVVHAMRALNDLDLNVQRSI